MQGSKSTPAEPLLRRYLEEGLAKMTPKMNGKRIKWRSKRKGMKFRKHGSHPEYITLESQLQQVTSLQNNYYPHRRPHS